MINQYDSYIWYITWRFSSNIRKGRLLFGNITDVNMFIQDKENPKLKRII